MWAYIPFERQFYPREISLASFFLFNEFNESFKSYGGLYVIITVSIVKILSNFKRK